MQRNIPQSFDNIQPVTVDVSGWLGRVSPMSKQSSVAQPSPYIRPRIGRIYERRIKELHKGDRALIGRRMMRKSPGEPGKWAPKADDNRFQGLSHRLTMKRTVCLSGTAENPIIPTQN